MRLLTIFFRVINQKSMIAPRPNLILVELLLVTLNMDASLGLRKFERNEPEHQAQHDDQHQGRAVEDTKSMACN